MFIICISFCICSKKSRQKRVFRLDLQFFFVRNRIIHLYMCAYYACHASTPTHGNFQLTNQSAHFFSIFLKTFSCTNRCHLSGFRDALNFIRVEIELSGMCVCVFLCWRAYVRVPNSLFLRNSI